MDSIRQNVKNFLKNNPCCQNFLQDVITKWEDKIKEETNDYKEEKVFNEAMKLCKYDVKCFKKSVLQDFKYKLEILKSTNKDYKLLKRSLMIDSLKNSFLLNDEIKNVRDFKIYRVVSNRSIPTEPNPSNPSQIILIHGTKAQNVEGILKTGFEASKSGNYGPGVYLTNNIKYACRYGKSFGTEENLVKKFRYLFLSSVKNPGKILPELFQFNGNTSIKEYHKIEPSVKIFNSSLTKPIQIKESSHDLVDSQDRKILKGSFLQEDVNENIALAHHKLVVPAYLVEVEEDTNLVDIAKHILYSCIKYRTPYPDSQMNAKKNKQRKTNKTKDSKVSENSFTKLGTVLKDEIEKIYFAKISNLISELKRETDAIMEQLSLQISSIVESKASEIRKFKTELLQSLA